jgi:HTH-type transcriptional regulator/antitoxin HigA
MNYKIIKTEEEYQKNLTRFAEVFDAPEGSSESDEADILALLIEKYEDVAFPIEGPDPIEAIKFRMEQLDMQNKDLANILDYKSRVSEILNRKRKLTLKMIRNLHDTLHIPFSVLMKEY